MPYLHAPTPISQPGLRLAQRRRSLVEIPGSAGSLAPLLSPAASPQLIVWVHLAKARFPYLLECLVLQLLPIIKDTSMEACITMEIILEDLSLGLIAIDKFRRCGKGNTSICISCNHFLSEQNRGPRATRPKSANNEQGQVTGSSLTPGV
ncbi:hypothetical protein KSP39_PZI017493 [Platanthera zijinensis]|uniref:Uncharacterized protein n=1 Tax=Platanthera zijinensis TaxID=2320716 RepID=A0AAP0G036_9ASPA